MPSRSRSIARINRLYSKGLDLLERDITAIDNLTRFNGEKLPSGPAKDLRDYMKLLEDMKAAQEKIKQETDNLKAKRNNQLPTEQLEQLLRAETGAAPSSPSKPLQAPKADKV
jgi:hypothetical protein